MCPDLKLYMVMFFGLSTPYFVAAASFGDAAVNALAYASQNLEDKYHSVKSLKIICEDFQFIGSMTQFEPSKEES